MIYPRRETATPFGTNSLARFIGLVVCAAALTGMSAHSHATLISRAVIDFNEVAAPRFALDNLSIDTATLDFTEVPTQPVDGLTVNGVTFTFTVGGIASADALYNTASGPGATALFQPPNMEGDASGILQLDFANPTSFLAFDLSLFSVGFQGIGGTVMLFDNNLAAIGGLLPIAVGLPATGLTEGRFSIGVPEPGVLLLLGLPLLLLVVSRRPELRRSA